MSSTTSGNIRPKPWEAQIPNRSTAMTSQVEPNNSVFGTFSTRLTDEEGPNAPSEALLRSSLNGIINGQQNINYGSIPMNNNMNMGYEYGNNMLRNDIYDNSFRSMYSNRYGNMYGNNFGSLYGSPYGNIQNGIQNMTESTQATFQLIESLVGAFTGFAQMLESTYLATHNSFFTMVSVAEQFRYLREMVGSFFGLFALMKFLKKILHIISKGKVGLPSTNTDNSSKGSSSSSSDDQNKLTEEFDEVKFRNKQTEDNGRKKSMSLKHVFLFITVVFGFPLLLERSISILHKRRSIIYQSRPIKSFKQELARAIYDFIPENPRIEIALKKNDLMTVISKMNPQGKESEWWKVKTRENKIGYVPYNYIQMLREVHSE